MATEPDEEMTICDRCSAEIPVAEANLGPEQSEWAGCTLCNDCYAEENQ